MPSKIKIPNLDNLVKLYLSGVSILELSKKSGFGRGVLSKKFVAAGINLRTQSEAETIKWKSIKSRGRKAVVAQCRKAWDASRGRKDSIESKMARAKTRYLRLTHVGSFESDVFSHLRRAGYSVRQQFPLGPYNIDIALYGDSIAVEICSDTNLPMSPRLRKRTKCILDCGWSLVQVFCHTPPFDVRYVTDQVLSFREFLRRQKTRPRKYWVIRGDGKVPARCGNYSDAPPIIWSPES